MTVGSGFELRPGGEPERRALLDLQRRVTRIEKAGGGGTSLDDLDDVDVPSPSLGDLLLWDGTGWVAEQRGTQNLQGVASGTTAVASTSITSPNVIDGTTVTLSGATYDRNYLCMYSARVAWNSGGTILGREVYVVPQVAAGAGWVTVRPLIVSRATGESGATASETYSSQFSSTVDAGDARSFRLGASKNGGSTNEILPTDTRIIVIAWPA